MLVFSEQHLHLLGSQQERYADCRDPFANTKVQKFTVLQCISIMWQNTKA